MDNEIADEMICDDQDEIVYLRPGEEEVTEEMIRREEEEILELEKRKEELEGRIKSVERQMTSRRYE